MTTQFLKTSEGRIAYEVFGSEGPFVVCVPGMGDLRDEYRLAVPLLLDAGYRVATMDVRGHGDSDTSFRDYSAAAIGRDILALIDALPGQRAAIAGTSMAAAAAVWAAAERPERVTSLVLIGPFVRDAAMSRFKQALVLAVMRVLLARPWGAYAWALLYRSFYGSALPDDFATYRRRLRQNLAQPGRLESLGAMMRASKADCEARLPEIHTPTLVVMGDKDPDFPDPGAEARALAQRLSGRVMLVPGAGHYPHAEAPSHVVPEFVEFLAQHAA